MGPLVDASRYKKFGEVIKIINMLVCEEFLNQFHVNRFGIILIILITSFAYDAYTSAGF